MHSPLALSDLLGEHVLMFMDHVQDFSKDLPSSGFLPSLRLLKK